MVQQILYVLRLYHVFYHTNNVMNVTDNIIILWQTSLLRHNN